MAKDLEKKALKKAQKLDAKEEKAEAKREELYDKIEELREQIADEPDEKKKNKLRKKRDELIAQREGIANSKDGMTIPMAKSTKRVINSCIAIVVIIALLFTYVATGAVRKGLISYFGLPQATLTGATITDGDGVKHKIKVSTYNYYFAMVYNNLQQTQSQYSQYGLDLKDYKLDVDFDQKLSKQTTENDDGEEVTWAKYIHDEVLESIRSTYTYYFEAVKANDGVEPDITEDQEKELQDTLDQYEETANRYGYQLSGYLTVAMGKGVTEKVFRHEAKVSYISSNYREEYNKELLKKTYSEEDYDAYKDEHYDDLVSVDIRLFECENEDDAKAFAGELKKNGSNFTDLAVKYAADDDKEKYEDELESTYIEITRPTIKNMGSAIATADEAVEGEDTTYSGLDWIYSSDREEGDVKQQSTSVVYILKPVYLSSTNTINVRHILITPFFDHEEDEENEDGHSHDASKATEEQWDAAYEQAEKILGEWKDGDATEDSFADLAKENSEDSNANDGGIYENVTPNQMVPSFNAWCFDSSREPGDTAIVKTSYGYHIMYFVSSNDDTPIWKYTAQQALASEDSQKTTTDLEDSYTIKENWFGSRYFQKDTDIDS